MSRWTLFLLYVAIGIWFSGWLQEVIYEKATRRNTSDNILLAKANAAPPPTCVCRVVDGKTVCTGCKRCPDNGGSGTIICNQNEPRIKAGSKPKPQPPKPKPKPNPSLPPIIIVQP